MPGPRARALDARTHSRIARPWWVLVLVAATVLLHFHAEANAGDAPLPPLPPLPPLRVGVTLHPYYSWAAAVAAGTDVVVVPVLPGDVDAGDYQPRPEDIARTATLDLLFVNGLGHDAFIQPMVAAAGSKARLIALNQETALLRGAHGEAHNSHTFLSLQNAIQQTQLMARELGALRPQHARCFADNASAYARRLRRLKASALVGLAQARDLRVITVHDGYSYLLAELGVELVGVVEPAHGLVPSAAELAAVVELVRRERVTVVLSEEAFPQALLGPLVQAGARVGVLSHIARGPYTLARFEEEMAQNIATLTALLTRPGPSHSGTSRPGTSPPEATTPAPARGP